MAWLKQTVASARHLVRSALGGSALALTDFTRQERLALLPYNFSTHRLQHWLLKLASLSEPRPKQTVALRAATLYGTIPASGRQMNFHGLAASALASATYWVLLTNYCHWEWAHRLGVSPFLSCWVLTWMKFCFTEVVIEWSIYHIENGILFPIWKPRISTTKAWFFISIWDICPQRILKSGQHWT